jgi:hypothetical protein
MEKSFLILRKIEFSRKIFEKIFKYQVSWKSFQWELSCSMKKNRYEKPIVDFRNFFEAPEINMDIHCRKLNVCFNLKSKCTTTIKVISV